MKKILTALIPSLLIASSSHALTIYIKDDKNVWHIESRDTKGNFLLEATTERENIDLVLPISISPPAGNIVVTIYKTVSNPDGHQYEEYMGEDSETGNRGIEERTFKSGDCITYIENTLSYECTYVK